MAATTPYAELTGVLDLYIAAYGEAAPDLTVAPSGNWYRLGETDGEQSIKHGGPTTYFRNNSRQGPSKAVRHESDVSMKARVVWLTMENYARIIHSAALISTGTSPVNFKSMPLSRSADFVEYALVARQDKLSPYGPFPGQYYIPRIIIVGEPEPKMARNGRPALEIEIRALEDWTTTAAEGLGRWVVQTS